MSPETPLPGAHDVDAQKEIRDCVRQNAGTQAAGTDGDPVIERTGEEGGGVIRRLMLQGEEHRDESERAPGESPEGNRLKILPNKIAEQKPAPEDFFHKRDHDRDAQKPEREPSPVCRRSGGEGRWIKRTGVSVARSNPKDFLRRNPDREHQEGNRDREEKSARKSEAVMPPEEDHERAAGNGLQGINPVLRAEDSLFGQDIDQPQHEQESGKGYAMSAQGRVFHGRNGRRALFDSRTAAILRVNFLPRGCLDAIIIIKEEIYGTLCATHGATWQNLPLRLLASMSADIR